MDLELQKQVSKVTQKKKKPRKNGLIGFLTNLDPNKMSLKFIFWKESINFQVYIRDWFRF